MFTRIALCVLFSLAATRVLADECALRRLTSIDVTVDEQGVLVPVTVAGKTSGHFLLNLNGPVSALAASTATSLSLKRSTISTHTFIVIDNKAIQEEAVDRIGVGAVSAEMPLAVIPDHPTGNRDIIGVLGTDFLKNFDVELDLAHGKLNLFAPHPCDGGVVYWSQTAPVAAVPLLSRGGQVFVISAQLDGRAIEGEISSSLKTQLSAMAARDSFGLDAAAIPPEGVTSHAFRTLSIDGLTITNPELFIYPVDDPVKCNGNFGLMPKRLANQPGSEIVISWTGGFTTRCYGIPDLVIGLPELRKLRIYIAYRKRMLYATAAGAN